MADREWCRNAAQLVPGEVKVTLDRDGHHPQKVKCSCGAEVTPMLLVGYGEAWFYPPHFEHVGRGDIQLDCARRIYDEATKFEVVLHYNDGDSYDSCQSANWLIQARDKLTRHIKHLRSVPFQPDR